MYEILDRSKDDVVGIRVSGRVTARDYDELIPRIEELIERHGRIRVLFDMAAFEAWQPAAIWKDLKFDVRHLADAERIAVVGDRLWEAWLAALGKPFTTAEIRYFHRDRSEEAWAWLEA